MDKKNIYWLIGGIVLTVLVWNFIIDRRQETKVVSKTDTLTVIKTVNKPIEIIKWKAKLDTIKVPEIINIHDTIWTSQIVASADTLLTKDSSSVKVKYFFPPANYFDIDLKIKEKITVNTITKEVIKPESFLDRFGYSIQGGFGYGLINKTFDVYVGVGVHFRIK